MKKECYCKRCNSHKKFYGKDSPKFVIKQANTEITCEQCYKECLNYTGQFYNKYCGIVYQNCVTTNICNPFN